MTMIAILSLIVAAATVVFVWWQARLLRFSLQVQSLLAIEKRFTERDYRRSRHHAARQLQQNRPEADVDEVLDFLDTLGLLVRRRALDPEMVWHAFFYWVDGYWRAAADVIQRERQKNPRVWEDLPRLYESLLAIENQRGVPPRACPGLLATTVAESTHLSPRYFFRTSTVLDASPFFAAGVIEK
jgi:hypothetical protein